ncbi:MAG TPA: ATP-dependent Clp protease ATP-binding subunit, partial [Planctomycetota bacterium]
IEKIVDLQITRVSRRLMETSQLTLEVTPVARALLAERGYDPDFGARPLRRTIEKEMVGPLANRILAGDFEAANTVVVDAQGTELVFRSRASSEAVGAA